MLTKSHSRDYDRSTALVQTTQYKEWPQFSKYLNSMSTVTVSLSDILHNTDRNSLNTHPEFRDLGGNCEGFKLAEAHRLPMLCNQGPTRIISN